MTRVPDPRPYLSVVRWPEDHGRELVAQLLADAVGVDFATMNLRLGTAPPSIVGHFEPDAARRGVAALREAGGDAFAVKLGEIEAMGASMKVKDLRLVEGDLEVDIWRGPTAMIRRDDVQILIRAQLSEKKIERRLEPPRDTDGRRSARAGLAWGVGGSMGLAIGMGAAYGAGVSPPPGATSIQTSDKLDIHTRSGAIFQIDGDKFGYLVLGDMRGYSDKANMDSMCELLAHIAPDEIVDPYFTLWTAPPGVARLRLPGLPMNKGERAFAFYSRWAATMYRYVMDGV